MTEPTSPDAARAGAAAAHDADVRALVFSDAESAKQWAHALPLTNVALVCETVRGQLKALSIAAFPARERATIAEVLRDLIAYLHTELARRYAGKGQPAVDREFEAADHAIALWQGLWEQYSACLKPLLEGDPELAGVKPKILQRGVYVGKQLVLVHGLARRTVPKAVWHELHAYFRLAEMLDCAVTAVSDNLMPNAVGISCYSTYSHALLLGLADPCSMSVKQIELTDRWLAMWARKVFPYARQRETEGPVILVDLDGGTGATLVPGVPREPAESLRFGYPGKLATSVRGRLKRLQTGANPAELQLGHDCSAEQCTTLLGHLDARWYQLPRRASDAPTATVELCAGGLPAAYFRVSGRTFDRKDPREPLSFEESAAAADAAHASPITTAAARTPSANGRGSAGRARTSGARPRIARSSDALHRWSLEQLAITRSGERLRVGFVTRVALDAPAELALSLRLWSGAPKAIALRPLSAAGSEDAPVPALLLDETPDDKACLVLPPRTFNPSRVLRSLDARCRAPVPAGPAAAARHAISSASRSKSRPDPPRRRGAPCAGTRPLTMPNRLAGETSPYLLQHADNPVDWHPWDDEALAQRAARGKADPAVDRLFGVPLVPRDGARVVRGPRRRRGDERELRQHQGRPRGAAGSRSDLSGGARAAHAAVGRMAAHDVPDRRTARRFSAAPIFRSGDATGCPGSSSSSRAWPPPIASRGRRSPSRARR